MSYSGFANIGVSKTAQDALTCKLSADLTYGSIYDSISKSSNQQDKEISICDYYQNYANVVVKKQNPLLNRFYFLRQQIMHFNFQKLLISVPSSTNGNIQVLILGGGYDVSYEYYESTQHHLHVFVVDFSEVLERREMYHSQRNGYSSKTIHYIPGDLLHFSALLQQLQDAGVIYSRPTIVIFECVLSYLPQDHVRYILVGFSSFFTSIALLEYDPLFGADRNSNSEDHKDFFRQTSSSFSQHDAPLLSHFSTTTELMNLHYRSGWKHLFALSLDQSLQYHHLSHRIDPLIQQSLESFDEFSSLHLLLSSYHVTVATNNSKWLQWFVSGQSDISSDQDRLLFRLKIAEEKLKALESFFSVSKKSRAEETDFVIRSGCKDDISDLTQLYLQVFDMYTKLNKFIQKYVKNATKDFQYLKSDDNRFIKFWICKEGRDGPVIGCVGVKIILKKSKPDTHFEVCNFCVDEKYRRRGLGRLLMEEVIKFCRENGQYQLELTVVDLLVEAREFYKKLGFQLISQHVLDGQCILHHLLLALGDVNLK